MILTIHKIDAFLTRLKYRMTGRTQLYDFRQTLYYGGGQFSSVWDSAGTPVLKAGFEQRLYQAFPDELRAAMLKTAEGLEDEAKKIRALYP